MKIEILFPEVCNLYGDLGNITLLTKSCPSLEIVRTPLFEKPAFLQEDIALVFMASVSERGQALAVQSLAPYLDEWKSAMDGGQRFLITGNALEIFGTSVTWDDGEIFNGLGLLPLAGRSSRYHRYNSLYLGTFAVEGAPDIDIVGFKCQFGHSYGDVPPLFQTVRGDGLNPEIKGEGVHIKNFMATYLLGPLLVTNPHFAKWLLTQMGLPNTLCFEDAAMDAYNLRLKEFTAPDINFMYH